MSAVMEVLPNSSSKAVSAGMRSVSFGFPTFAAQAWISSHRREIASSPAFKACKQCPDASAGHSLSSQTGNAENGCNRALQLFLGKLFYSDDHDSLAIATTHHKRLQQPREGHCTLCPYLHAPPPPPQQLRL